MKCPHDGATLQMTDRQGIEIDYCPECRGIWLDRGELDKLIERAAAMEAPRAPAPAPQAPMAPPTAPGAYTPPIPTAPLPPQPQHAPGYGYGDDWYRDRKRKKKGLLGELFDF